jgi:hypothetical protein
MVILDWTKAIANPLRKMLSRFPYSNGKLVERQTEALLVSFV